MIYSLVFSLPLFINRIGGPQWIIILLIILLLFGGSRIPQLMRSLGKGIRSFKEGLNDAADELNVSDKDQSKKESHKE